MAAVAAGRRHSLALKADGSVVAWGVNGQGQLGGGEHTHEGYPVQVKGVGGSGYLSGVSAIEAGYERPRRSASGSGDSSRLRLRPALSADDGCRQRGDHLRLRPRGEQEQRGTRAAYSYDRADRITGAGTVSYTVNANGNLVPRGADAFAYDQANRLKTASVGGTQLELRLRRGRQARQQDGMGETTNYVYDVNATLPVLLDDGTRKYVWGLGLAYAVDSRAAPSSTTPMGWGRQGAHRRERQRRPDLPVRRVRGGHGQPGDHHPALRVHGRAARRRRRGLVYLRARYYDAGSGRLMRRDPVAGVSDRPRLYQS